MISGRCNTAIGECLTDEGEGGEEFLMESKMIRSSARDSFKFLTKYLKTFSGEDAYNIGEAKEEAVCTIIEFVKAPDMFQGNITNVISTIQANKITEDATQAGELIAPERLREFVKIARNCLLDRGTEWPSIDDVEQSPQIALQLQQTWNNDMEMGSNPKMIRWKNRSVQPSVVLITMCCHMMVHLT
ncbi:hypothetical protein TEA_020799 [Camellia sinensis var. sinensis]|uniref:Uncharacterized protein n=1 Tax=Camellia sinensis var. sinensis TaxID=542762 RepID=A0A4S4D0Q1_CAMSN|nr:hypothetical protein TEA_020799 [Camellia sinensis var. sinensis]